MVDQFRRVPFTQNDIVQTPLGKGVVREVRNRGRLLVEVQGRALELAERDVQPIEAPPRRSRAGKPALETGSGDRGSRPARVEVDLHGLTVEEALARAEEALSEALLADAGELRLIHGKSGGRIKSALHRRLKELPSVRRFGIDPRNDGVTIVKL